MERISTNYLEFLTDDFSIWQHSNKKRIDKNFGYALDDAARAMIFTIQYGPKELTGIYLNFLVKCIENDNCNNFYGKNRKSLNLLISEDAIGQTYWAIMLWNSMSNSKYSLANLETRISEFHSIRGKAYSLLGAILGNYTLAKLLQKKLLDIYNKNSTRTWPWIEQCLTYGNAIIPLSFLAYHKKFQDKDVFAAGLSMLDFLNKETKYNSVPITIGNKGWYYRNKKKSLYDQQPVDISYQVLANIEAYEITSNNYYLTEAKFYFSWFWGNNISGKVLVDCNGKRCLDGLMEKSVSKNSGAESIICYLWAQEKIWPYLDSAKTTRSDYQKKTLENFYGDTQ